MTSEEMKNLQNYIIESMTLVAQNAISDASFVKIEEGIIIEVIDEALGKYKVKYLDNELEADSAYTTLTYHVGDKVNILFTNDKMDEAKLIISAVTPTAANYAGGTSGASYLEISGNLFDGLPNNIEMSSYYYRMKEKASPHNEIDISYIIGNNFKTLFNTYIQDYSTSEEQAAFSLEMLVKTTIPSEQFTSGGDYGICLEIPTYFVNEIGEKIDETVHKFYLNTDNMTGSPYSYHEYTYKNTLISLDAYEIFDSSREVQIYAYCDDNFKQKETIQDSDLDIFIQEINLKCVQVYETNDSIYELTLTATDGPNFLQGSTNSEKTIIPNLRISGKATSVEPYDCYWFKEDSSVRGSSSDGFSTFGGVGWLCLNNYEYTEEGNISYITSKKSLSIPQSDIVTSCRYKCVLDCDGIAVSSIINIKNLNSNVNIELETNPKIIYPNSGVATFICKVDYPDLFMGRINNTNLIFEWARHDNRDNLINDVENSDIVISSVTIENGKYVCTYSLPVSYINIANTVYCSVYTLTSEGTQNLVGTANKTATIEKVSDSKFTILLKNGDILYKYDTNGNSPFLANYSGAVGSVPAAIEPINFKIFKPNGEEFTKDEYGVCEVQWAVPINSMFEVNKENYDEEYYYIKDKSLVYKINDRFDANKAAGEIVLTVDFQGEVMQTKPRIVFTKDGENGTNGSMYTAMIKHNGFAYNEYDPEYDIYRKLKFVWKCSDAQGNGSWFYHDQVNNTLVPFNSLEECKLDVLVYKGSTLQDTQAKITWSMFDEKATSPCFTIDSNGVIDIDSNKEWKESDAIFCNTVEALIQVGNESETNSEEYIYAYYPIEITRLSVNGSTPISLSDSSKLVPHLADGYSTVLYAEDGTNPSWNTQPFKCVSPSIVDSDLKGYYKYNWSSSRNLKTNDRTTSTCVFEPVTKFDNGISKNYVRVAINAIQGLTPEEAAADEERLETQIQTYTNYTNQVDSIILNSKNWMTNTSTNTLESYLKDAKDYLDKRSEVLRYLNGIKYVVEEFGKMLNANKIFVINNYIPDLSTFGKQYLTDNIQPYYSKVCNYNLSVTYNETLKSRLYININTLFEEDLEPNITNNLSDIGLNLYDSIKEEIEARARGYNYYVDILTELNGLYYKCRNSYVNFTNFISTLTSYKNQANFRTLKDMEFLDENCEYINFYLNNIKNYYSIIDNIFYDYVLDDVDIKCNYNYDYYNFKKQKVISIIEQYGVSTNNFNTSYVLKEDLETNLNACREEYNSNKNSYEGQLQAREAIYDSGNASIIHVKPIVMTLNRYSNSYINGWDGNKLYIDEENGQYLFAPQMGAGYKDNGRFTGMLMGVRGSNQVGEDTDVGLFGYHQGEQSIFLDSRTGSATFGVSGEGQIKIEPGKEAIIESGNYFPKTQDEPGSGMQINLTKPSIEFGSGKFSVDPTGEMTAEGGGHIGGWEIGIAGSGRSSKASVLRSPLTIDGNRDVSVGEVIYLDSNAYKNEQGDYVKDQGYHAAIYTGNHKNLGAVNEGFYLDPTGMSINSFFRVSGQGLEVGDLTLKSSKKYWTINGNEKGGEGNSYIAFGTDKFSNTNMVPLELDDSNLIGQTEEEEFNQIYLGTDGFRLGNDKFYVTPTGYLFSKKGRIADWLITDDRLLGATGSGRCKMELNSRSGYFSYTATPINTTYGTIENEDQIKNVSKGYILNPNGLFFAKWRTFLDNQHGYIHATYGDLGGFHFSNDEFETGKVPMFYYVATSNDYIETRIGRETISSDYARNTDGDFDPDTQETEILPLEEGSYNPIQTDPNKVYDFTNYVKLSAKKQCLLFNTFDFTDLYNYFQNPPSDVDDEYDDGNNQLPGESAGFKYGCYLGKKGISIGTNFSVNASGKLYARNGLVGGWLINQNSISSPQQTIGGKYYRTVFKPQGTLQGGQLTSDGSKKWKTSCMWKLNKDGRAWFTDVTITGGEIEIKKNNNTTFKVTNEGVLTCTDAYIGGVHFKSALSQGESGISGNNGNISLNGWHVTEGGQFNSPDDTSVSLGSNRIEMVASEGHINLGSGTLSFGQGVYLSGSGGSGRLQLDSNNSFAGGTVGLITTKAKIQNLEVTNGLKIGNDSLEDYIKGIIDAYGAPPRSHTHSVSVSTNINGTDYAGSGTANGW